MSSTGRGPRGGGEHDYFPTPSWATKALLDAAPELPGGLWLEPAVGEGAIVREVERVRPLRQRWITIDVRPEAGGIQDPMGAVFEHLTGDFLTLDLAPRRGPDVIITNPPFKLAEAFARRCLALAADTGTVALLLRLAFLESQERASFHAEHPADIYPLARRPSFSANGKTDSTAYAWWLWGPGRGNRWFTPIGLDAPPEALEA